MKSGSQAAWKLSVGAVAAIRTAEPASLSHEVDEGVADAYELDPLHDPRWGALVDSHPRASVFHSTSWLRALQTVYGYEPVVVTTCPPGARLTNGVVFCRIKSWLTGRRVVSLPFSDHCEPLVDTADEFDYLLVRMRRYVDEDKKISPSHWKSATTSPMSKKTRVSRSWPKCWKSAILRTSCRPN